MILRREIHSSGRSRLLVNDQAVTVAAVRALARQLVEVHGQGEHVAYLVGGSVRDLLLSRRPKDFDIGTSAHPYQVKRLFRNCWIIGRRCSISRMFSRGVRRRITHGWLKPRGRRVRVGARPSPSMTSSRLRSRASIKC